MLSEEEKQRIRDGYIRQVKKIMTMNDPTVTYWVDLGTYNGHRWAIVLGWVYAEFDYEEKYEAYAKLAHQPTNSAMQEYNMDWTMPIKNDLVWDTEIPVVGDPLTDVNWFLRIFENMSKDEEIEPRIIK